MRIVVDAMGGDRAPGDIVRGALLAASEYGVEITLVGDMAKIEGVIKEIGSPAPAGLEIIHASEQIEMEEHPSVVKVKKDSSIVRGLQALAQGGGAAFVSAGNTGAVLTAATLYVKRIQGIRRAALAPFLPREDGGSTLLIDCGANLECTPEFLLQFAYMGSYYAQKVMGISSPRVALLNVGTEDTKGDELRKETFRMLNDAKSEGRLNFVGNVEGRDALYNTTDVLVTDGFTGNVLLKSVEGVGMLFMGMMKNMFVGSTKGKLAAALVMKDLKAMKKLLDYTETGGAPLLGLSMPVIKAHGSCNVKAMKNAIGQAIRFANAGIIEEIQKNIEYMKV